MRSLSSYTSALRRLVLFSAWPITETLLTEYPQSLKMALFVSGDLFFSLPLILPAWKRRELSHQKKQTWERDFAGKRKEGNSRLWAVVHLVPGLGGRDAVLAVENDVFLLGFVDVCPVDLLRDALQLCLGYGITAAGKAL